MATRPPCTSCLIPRPRRVSGSHGHVRQSNRHQRIATMAVVPFSETMSLVTSGLPAQESDGQPHSAMYPSRYREAMEAFQFFVRLRASRTKFLDKLIGADSPEAAPRGASKPSLSATFAGPVSHERFREIVKVVCPHGPGPVDKPLRTVIRNQLLHCDRPMDIYKVFAVAMPRERAASALASMYDSVIRAIYRCRAHVDDSTVLHVIGGVIGRLSKAGLPVANDLFVLGVKFAARTRSKDHMKKYLRHLRERNIILGSSKFRAIIAKCSIGSRGLGEIRNGRWRRDDLLEVLHGFHDCHHLPPDKQFHLETFVDRDDWPYLHGWSAILARCRDVDSLRKEWDTWKVTDARLRPKTIISATGRMTSKRRGEHFFIEQFAIAGGLREAWAVMQEAELNFADIHRGVQLLMLEAIEYAPSHDDSIRQGLIRKCDVELQKIETALGVKWRPADAANGILGSHEIIEDMELALERLAAPDWKFDTDFGYPYPTTTDAEPTQQGMLTCSGEHSRAL